jgi:hypothetical protein
MRKRLFTRLTIGTTRDSSGAWGGLCKGKRIANQDDRCWSTQGFLSDTKRNSYVESHDWLILDNAKS